MKLFSIMPCRYETLQNTIEGYERTGVQLVAYKDYCTFHNINPTAEYGPACFADDPGACYFIPKLVEIFGVSLDTAVQLMYSGSVFLAFLVGSIASFLYCETRFGKLTSVIAIGILSFIIAGVGDLYVFLGSVPLALIPLWLYLQKIGNSKYIIPYFVLAGLTIAFAQLMRVHSSTATLIFICISLIFFSNHFSNKIKFLSVLGLVFAMSSVFLSFNVVVQERTDFLIGIGSTFELSGFRILWHNAYYSLGYLWNNFGFSGWYSHEPSDTYSLSKALSIRPDVIVFSREYEDILKYAYFEFVKEHPFFFLQTIFAKIGILLMYIFMFANIGLILSMYYPQGIKFNLLFLLAIGFNMIFGVLAMPSYTHLLGLFAFSTLFNIYSIDFAVQKGFLKRFKWI